MLTAGTGEGDAGAADGSAEAGGDGRRGGGRDGGEGRRTPERGEPARKAVQGPPAEAPSPGTAGGDTAAAQAEEGGAQAATEAATSVSVPGLAAAPTLGVVPLTLGGEAAPARYKPMRRPALPAHGGGGGVSWGLGMVYVSGVEVRERMRRGPWLRGGAWLNAGGFGRGSGRVLVVTPPTCRRRGVWVAPRPATVAGRPPVLGRPPPATRACARRLADGSLPVAGRSPSAWCQMRTRLNATRRPRPGRFSPRPARAARAAAPVAGPRRPLLRLARGPPGWGLRAGP